jgi:hypothetical protein
VMIPLNPITFDSTSTPISCLKIMLFTSFAYIIAYF